MVWLCASKLLIFTVSRTVSAVFVLVCVGVFIVFLCILVIPFINVMLMLLRLFSSIGLGSDVPTYHLLRRWCMLVLR